jgi:hypothetical protein
VVLRGEPCRLARIVQISVIGHGSFNFSVSPTSTELKQTFAWFAANRALLLELGENTEVHAQEYEQLQTISRPDAGPIDLIPAPVEDDLLDGTALFHGGLQPGTDDRNQFEDISTWI